MQENKRKKKKNSDDKIGLNEPENVQKVKKRKLKDFNNFLEWSTKYKFNRMPKTTK